MSHYAVDIAKMDTRQTQGGSKLGVTIITYPVALILKGAHARGSNLVATFTSVLAC